MNPDQETAMSLQYRFFTIPIKDPRPAAEEMNQFLRSVQAIVTHREFLQNGENSCWLMAVEYQTGEGEYRPPKSAMPVKRKIDYKEVLSPEDFTIYARLRDWRKETGEKEAVQLYNIFTNEQMATIVQDKIVTKNGLKKLSGVGEGRVDKYGDAVIAIIKEELGKLEKKPEASLNGDSGELRDGHDKRRLNRDGRD